MKVIMIMTYASMPDRLKVECDPGRAKRTFGRDARNSGEAAAIAMSYATADGSDYVILGHKEALDQIPVDLRMRRSS